MSLVITSDSHPILANFLPVERFGLPGKVGLTLAPGVKHQHPDVFWDRDLEKDLRRLSAEYGTTLLVTLIEEHEFETLRVPRLREQVRAHSIQQLWFPIRDMSVPPSMEEFAGLVGQIIERAREGQTIVIHCMAGLGRAGLVAACCLVALGFTPDEAIKEVREVRPGSLQTPQQAEYIHSFADYRALQSRA